MRRSLAAATLAVILSWISAAPAPAQVLEATTRGNVVFAAPTYATIADLHADKPAAGKASLFLWLPEGAGPFPAVMISHTVGGWNELIEGAAAKQLLAQGYAVAGLDHFGPRGLTSVHQAGSGFSTATAASDALVGLKLLATHPKIDGKRIGIIGFSMGGNAAHLSAYEFLAARYAGADGPRFAAHVAFYPTSLGLALDGAKTVTGAPVLLLVAGLDASAPAAKMQQIVSLVRALQPAAAVELVIYPNAHHAWNNPRMTQPRPGGFHPGACPLFDLGRDFGLIAADGSRQPYTPKTVLACTQAGGKYTVMYDGRTTQQAEAAMLVFLAKHLRPGS